MKPEIIMFLPDLLGARGDHAQFFDRVAETGCKRLHFLPFWASPGGCQAGAVIMPYLVIGKWKHPSSGKTFPYYKLTNNWNQTYFDQLRADNLGMKLCGITPDVSLHDIRLRDKNEKYYHPYYCSYEALGPNTPGGVWGNEDGEWPMGFYFERFVKVFVPKVLKIHPKARFEDDNEFNTPSFAHAPGDAFDLYMVNSVRPKMTAMLVAAGVPRSRIWTSGDRRNWQAAASRYSAHGIVRPENVKALHDVPNGKLIISMDGGFNGDGRADKVGRKGASVAQTIGIVKAAKKMGAVAVEVMDRGIWKKNKSVANLDDFDPATLEAAVNEAERTGA